VGLRTAGNRRRIDAAGSRFDDAGMSFRRVFLSLLLALLPLAALAQQQPGPEQDSTKFVDEARQQLATIGKQLQDPQLADANLDAFRDGATAIAAEADALILDRTPKLAALDTRLSELGPPPQKGDPPEAADIAAERADVQKQHADLEAEIKRAKLLSVDSHQLIAQIAEARTANFQAQLSQRTPSPLTPTFWKSVTGNLVSDAARLAALRSGIAAAIADGFAPDNRAYAIGGLVVGLLLMVLGRWWVERALMRFTANHVPHGRLRRSALALATVVVATLFTGLGAQAIAIGLDWHDALSVAEKQLARSLITTVYIGSFIAGLGRALLSPARPSWRLPPISDAIAERLRFFAPALGFAAAFNILVRRVNSAVGASIAATITAMLVSAIMYCGLLIWALTSIGRARREARAERPADADSTTDADPSATRSLWAVFVSTACWIGCLLSLGAVVVGYIAFGQFVSQQMIWIGIVAGTFYLLVHLIEDLCSTTIGARAKWMEDRLGVHQRTLEQLAVVLSGAFRVVAFVFALSLVLTRFGSSPAELLARGTEVSANGLRIGEIVITPGALLGSFAVFLLGLMAIRGLQRWLGNRYLPTTSLDPGMRISVTTLLGYVGIVVVIAFALSELGLPVERIAWVASALSVGIGFGLQAVVQNFVSGLILLVERPVKVGDWVALGDVEGDIRRINVRATEIQMSDRSTVIVPNSELITKTVRNITHGNAEGRVRVRLPMPMDVDADRVIAVMRDVLATHSVVLDAPSPSVQLDGIENSALVFIGVAYIDNPRQTGAIRSELLLDILARLRDAGIQMVSPHEIALRRLDDTAPAFPPS
jgi:small-conductance mechanosensitive channel